MKKILLLVCFLLPLQANAEPLFSLKGSSIEIGTFLGGNGVTGSPVPVSGSGNGYGLKAVMPLTLPPLPSGKYSDLLNLAVTVGYDQWRVGDISMGGVNLGPYRSSTWSTTVRVYPRKTCKVCPYSGIGLYNEESDQSSMAGGVLVMNSASRTGVMAEVGVNVMLPFLDGETFYGDFNLSNRFDPNKSEIKTNPGSALVTRVSKDETLAKISAGVKF